MEIYRTEVVGLGNSAMAFLEEKMLIFFNKKAEGDLAEYSVLIDDLTGEGEIAPGDVLLLGDQAFKITAVGDVANVNFRELGHAVIHFDGKDIAELPGQIHVADSDIPEIAAGLPVVFKKEA